MGLGHRFKTHKCKKIKAETAFLIENYNNITLKIISIRVVLVTSIRLSLARNLEISNNQIHNNYQRKIAKSNI